MKELVRNFFLKEFGEDVYYCDSKIAKCKGRILVISGKTPKKVNLTMVDVNELEDVKVFVRGDVNL